MRGLLGILFIYTGRNRYFDGLAWAVVALERVYAGREEA